MGVTPIYTASIMHTVIIIAFVFVLAINSVIQLCSLCLDETNAKYGNDEKASEFAKVET